MVSKTSEKNTINSGNPAVDGFYHTIEWLVGAFAGVLVFIVFVMQVYRIPTGSMAPTLRGAHFRVRCAECGYAYDHDFIADLYGVSNIFTPSYKLPILHQVQTPAGSPLKFIGPRCPCCGYEELPVYQDNIGFYTRENNRRKPPFLRTVFKGDQIFVMKSIYQFFEPKRWDVIVFKNPTEPRINFIKRCIGLPNETVIILDGDVYADGIIQRKPDKVQEELWMVVYDNDYQPIHPNENRFNEHPWRQPFENVSAAAWNLAADGPTAFALDTDSDEFQRIRYNDDIGNDFRATYAYDDPRTYRLMPICSDLMVRYYLQIDATSAAGAQIEKYGIAYQGLLFSDGAMQIIRLTPDGESQVLKTGQCAPEDMAEVNRFRFATLDHQLVLEYGKTRIVYDLGTGFDDAGTNRGIEPQVQILGFGRLRLSHIALFRDIHYISEPSVADVLRGTSENPMVLREDEYFACGDNSPYSLDSRMWQDKGLGNNGDIYPAGVVPKDYLVGKGLIVHWPGGYRIEEGPLSKIPIPPRWLRWIPNVDDMKIIYGGKD